MCHISHHSLNTCQYLKDQPGSPKPGVVEEALKYVQRQVRPGSTLVANDRAMCCSFNMVKDLPGYPSVISVETLMELDLPGTRRIQENLGECCVLNFKDFF